VFSRHTSRRKESQTVERQEDANLTQNDGGVGAVGTGNYLADIVIVP